MEVSLPCPRTELQDDGFVPNGLVLEGFAESLSDHRPNNKGVKRDEVSSDYGEKENLERSAHDERSFANFSTSADTGANAMIAAIQRT